MEIEEFRAKYWRDKDGKWREKIDGKEKRKNKYNAKPCRCALNHQHRSGDEAEYCGILQLRQKARDFLRFEFEVSWPLKVLGQVVGSHKVDFTLYDFRNNVWQVHEFKGVETEGWSLRRGLFRLIYPNIPYITVKKTKRGWINK